MLLYEEINSHLVSIFRNGNFRTVVHSNDPEENCRAGNRKNISG
jgi:hypothetical protein